MGWVWTVGAAWLLLSVGLALLIGRSIGLADRKTAGLTEDAPNFIVDRPPLTVLPTPADGPASDLFAADGPAAERPLPSPRGVVREAPTIPGIPAARPPVGRPPVPRSTRQHRQRKTGLG